jgi:hypothetical protein
MAAGPPDEGFGSYQSPHWFGTKPDAARNRKGDSVKNHSVPEHKVPAKKSAEEDGGEAMTLNLPLPPSNLFAGIVITDEAWARLVRYVANHKFWFEPPMTDDPELQALFEKMIDEYLDDEEADSNAEKTQPEND